VPLDLVDDLPPLLHIRRPPLPHQQVIQHRVVDMAPVPRLPRVVLAEEEAVGLEEGREGAEAHGVELAEAAGGLVGAVLLLIELGVDADVLELLDNELRVVDELGGAVVAKQMPAAKPLGWPAAARSRFASPTLWM
jgi:hypothetical protein